jgi:integrase
MGVRSHAKGTFLAEVEPGQQIEEQELSKVRANNLVVNIVFAWEHAVAITSEADAKALVSHRFPQFSFHDDMEPGFFRYATLDEDFRRHLWLASPSGAGRNKTLNIGTMLEYEFIVPSRREQTEIAKFFDRLDNLITLHQRDHRTARTDSPAALILVSFSLREPPNHEEGEESSMLSQLTKDDLLCTYYREWIAVYKEGAVRQVTLNKYSLALAWVERLAPELTLGQLDRIAYQGLLNQYAKTHERQTTMDFHHQLKGAILDAVDEGLVPRDPTRKAIVKGKPPRPKKSRYLNQFELHKLLASLELGQDIGWEWFILLVAKTGLRFSEALAVTPADFDFSRQTLSVSKTWDYKNGGGFVPTKNRSSIRKVQIDWQLIVQFSVLIKGLPEDKPMFVKDDRKVYNSTANDVLARLCRKAEVPVISIHGLRHTHASLLLFAGVSIASVAKRLGHASMNTTEKTYLHIIQELENKDVDLVMRSLTSLV